MENSSISRLDKRLQTILNDVLEQHGLHSLLLADQSGLPICHCGDIVHAGMAAIAPELIKVGDHAVQLGEYDGITCIALVLENSRLMVIKDIEINGEPFVLVMDTATVPRGMRKLLSSLRDRIAMVMHVEREKKPE